MYETARIAWAGRLSTRKDVETRRSVFVTRASDAEVGEDCPFCPLFLPPVPPVRVTPVEFKLVVLLPILMWWQWQFCKLVSVPPLLLPPLSTGLFLLPW